MNFRKWVLYTASLTFALCTIGAKAYALEPIEFSLHNGHEQIHGYRPLATDLSLRQDSKNVGFPIQSHHLFEQARPQSLNAHFRYKLSPRLSLTNEYGTTSQGNSDPEFHTMLRFNLKF
tara:strand:- start:342268 stop:342624 length:357 start_codon:yes stop_codon:yes gene_type:complete